VRIHILSKDKLPTLSEEFVVVRSKETRRGAMLNEHNPESSTLMTSKARFRVGKLEAQTKNSSHEGQWCSYYKKPQHKRDTYFKLHGKEAVLNKVGGFRNMKH